MNLEDEHRTAEDEHARIYGEEHERRAPYCYGPGHRMEWDEDGWMVRAEDCPACVNQGVRNHLAWRLPEGVDL